MGDEAEGVFEKVHKEKWVRFGFNRPPFRMTHLSSFVRHTPDYCDRFGLWDCMGLGRDGVLKLKVEKYDALRKWDHQQKTGLFVWNSALGEYAYITMTALHDLVGAAIINRGVKAFNDGNEYYPILWADVQDKTVLS